MESSQGVEPVVLVFEDDLRTARMIEQVLSDRPFRVVHSDSPDQDILKSHDCAASDAPCKGVIAIFSDQDMPVMKGTEFFTLLKDSPCRLARTYKILLSARMPDQIPGFPELSGVRYISKPFSLAVLQSAADKAISLASGQDSPSEGR